MIHLLRPCLTRTCCSDGVQSGHSLVTSAHGVVMALSAGAYAQQGGGGGGGGFGAPGGGYGGAPPYGGGYPQAAPYAQVKQVHVHVVIAANPAEAALTIR